MKRCKKEDSCTRDDPDLKGRDHRSCDPSCFKSRFSGGAGESEGDLGDKHSSVTKERVPIPKTGA